MESDKKHLSTKVSKFLYFGLLLVSNTLLANPFELCPNELFTIDAKGNISMVNAITGHTTLIKSVSPATRNIDGLSFFNGYLYGYDHSKNAIARFDRGFQPSYVTLENRDQPYNFTSGIISDDKYYLVDNNHGLFSIELKSLSEQVIDNLVPEPIASFSGFSFNDLAAHPTNHSLYTIDADNNNIYRINIDTGSLEFLDTIQSSVSLQASHFDESGNIFLLSNNKGDAYRVSLDTSNTPLMVEKFFTTDNLSIQDSARCIEAGDKLDSPKVDFGDAPDTYQTSLLDNGPRHQYDGKTYLGTTQPDYELDAITGSSRDDYHRKNDEDGVTFVTSIEPGKSAILKVNASSPGYLQAWFDWNSDGQFDAETEHTIQNMWIEKGEHSIDYHVSHDAITGNTWTRFRFSQQESLEYYGGAPSGEVEDHLITVTNSNMFTREFPSRNGYATLIFEDYWPYVSDFDMNDVVMFYRVTEVYQNSDLHKIYIKGRLAALGADYYNGFAVRLMGLPSSAISTSRTTLYHNDQMQEHNGLEKDSGEAIFIVTQDLKSLTNTQCEYYRTKADCIEAEHFNFELEITLEAGADTSQMKTIPYDPFIFATPGYYHGDALPLHPGRSWEVHLPDVKPTEKFNKEAMWKLGSDDSSDDAKKYFKTHNNLPWALLIPEEWYWPLERKDPLSAYPKFAEYAVSGGTRSKNWFKHEHAVSNYIYPR
ncbi:LruC domain-containing protein [Vibrio astriarenae]|uniref:LruC domain-containing protein n=1 Tax=Vibrio astriarenae TaxID=1481923 RepID=UPI0037364FF3